LTSKLLVDDMDTGILVLSFTEPEVLIVNVKLDKDINYWTLGQGEMRFIKYSNVDNNSNYNLNISDTSGIVKNETLKQLQDKGFQLIPEQSFDINLENWGNVKFVFGFQDDDFEIPKLGLYLTDSDGAILYSFPEFYGNIWVLFDVDAVAFKDVNGDGLKDVIVIAEYILGHGENAAEEFPVSGVYFQKGNEFISLPGLDDELNNKNVNESIIQVINYVEKMHIDINSQLGLMTKTDFTPNFSGIKEIMNLKKEQVLKLLGDDYKVIQTGAEASEEGYYYKKYGITIVFDDFSMPDMIKDIECTEKVDILGIKIGMTFSGIKNILGSGNVSELVQIEQDQPKYELDYKYDDFVVWFGTLENNGITTVLEIRRNYMN
jgi:hypothetical protein